MSTKINKIKILFALLITAFIVSCNDNEAEQIFEDSTTVRKQKREQELRNLLKGSPDGWKVTYFTDNDILGGYTFLFKFLDDSSVEMASDFTNEYTTAISEYDILFSSTTKLSFTTKNKIHDLSDSNNAPDAGLRGRGYKGDFEFLYYGTDGEDIIFRTNRDFIELRFKKATAQDWVDLSKHEPMKSNIAVQVGKSVFRTLKVGDKLYNFSYNANRRFATNTDDSNGNLNFGIGFTPTGITIDPALDVNGEKISEFIYDATEDKFVASLNGSEVASIFYASTPAFPFTGYEDINRTGLAYNEYPGETVETNQAFQDFLANYRQNLTNSGITLRFFQFQEMENNAGWFRIGIAYNGNNINLWFDFTMSVVDNKLIFTRGSNGPHPSWEPFMKPLTDIIFDPQGHFVKNAGSMDQFNNAIFTLIPASFTQYLMEFYAFG
ncbi:exported hypothetical protein [Tenacibaculum sp. 190524A02b]|uniref:DUF4302 domain-containing protein n=1 Tax=Tenacibaculum vairaonense TaxID=3137860 RepID=A0ABM9PJC1_9FLAO